jgi:low affinity Fe/Cu permease
MSSRIDRLRKLDTDPARQNRAHSGHVARLRASDQRGGGPFRKFSRAASNAVGRPWAFAVAVGTVVIWAATGPLFKFSDTWQLVINTGTTIITFLMVFLIQNTQNRDTEALRIKLDELILATREARDEFVDIDDLADSELEALEEEVRALARERCDDGEQSAEHAVQDSTPPERAGEQTNPRNATKLPSARRRSAS